MVGKIESNQEFNLIDLKALQMPEEMPDKTSSMEALEENINKQYICKSTFTEMIKNMELFAEKDTHLGKSKTIEIKIDTADHLPIKQTIPNPFAK